MEPITTVLTGIALVKQSVEFIKSNIETVKDIGEIAEAIDGLFAGEQQVQKERFGNKSIIASHKSVASDIIDAKLAQEKLYEMSMLIDLRFGNGTWQQIVNERAKRIQEEKKAEAERKKQEQIRKEHVQDILVKVGIGVSIILIAIGSVFGVIEFNGD
jgi:hypothetical protein